MARTSRVHDHCHTRVGQERTRPQLDIPRQYQSQYRPKTLFRQLECSSRSCYGFSSEQRSTEAAEP